MTRANFGTTEVHFFKKLTFNFSKIEAGQLHTTLADVLRVVRAAYNP